MPTLLVSLISFSLIKNPQEKAEKKEALKTFILNAYKVMMTRGIKGCYVYAYNKGLKEYLSKLIHNR